jgi:hypothetical protein
MWVVSKIPFPIFWFPNTFHNFNVPSIERDAKSSLSVTPGSGLRAKLTIGSVYAMKFRSLFEGSLWWFLREFCGYSLLLIGAIFKMVSAKRRPYNDD